MSGAAQTLHPAVHPAGTIVDALPGCVRFRVQGAEALLSALELMGVDNARIEIEGGPEVPVVDGSALGWAIEIHAVS